MTNAEVVIAGAGPCGLACARELRARGHDRLVIHEASDRPGGLAGSVVDPNGFTWDLGGHVMFSHYAEFDALIDELMGDDLSTLDRSSFALLDGVWVPYPVQQHLDRLPESMRDTVLADAQERHAAAAHDDFDAWMRAQFGDALVDAFMGPYNAKVWVTPATEMSASWIAERVAPRAAVSVDRSSDRSGARWGPNASFAYPRRGGIGEICTRLAATLGDHIRYDDPIVGVDPRARRVRSGRGSSGYDTLVWTGPLDLLVAEVLEDRPSDVADAAASLAHTSVAMVGIGYESPLCDERSWLYFSEPDIPFYRATNLARYAAANVPDADTTRYSSWMTEVAARPGELPADDDDLVAAVDDALRRIGLAPGDARVASAHVERIERAYPVPTRQRDAALAIVQPWLEEHGILARGRFGAWRYELGNMDHAVKMGVDVARRILDATPEQTWSSID